MAATVYTGYLIDNHDGTYHYRLYANENESPQRTPFATFESRSNETPEHFRNRIADKVYELSNKNIQL